MRRSHTPAPEDALARLAAAQAAAAQSLNALAERLRSEGREEEAGIFDAQALLVEDQFLSDEVDAPHARSGRSR